MLMQLDKQLCQNILYTYINTYYLLLVLKKQAIINKFKAPVHIKKECFFIKKRYLIRHLNLLRKLFHCSMGIFFHNQSQFVFLWLSRYQMRQKCKYSKKNIYSFFQVALYSFKIERTKLIISQTILQRNIVLNRLTAILFHCGILFSISFVGVLFRILSK